MKSPRPKYWFPAKRYGWGWGLPTCWEGWLVFGVYVALFVLGIIILRGEARPAKYLIFVSVLTLGLLLICWKKGEPPRWRWGGD
jgi:hypothetical protein